MQLTLNLKRVHLMKVSNVFILILLIIFCNSGCSSSPNNSIQKGDLNDVISTIQGKGDINYKDDSGRTPLHHSAAYGQMDIARYLVSHGADINVKDNVGDTPLQIAAYEGHKDLVVFLVSKDADVNTVNSYGVRPVHNAIIANNADIAKYLVSNGADVNIRKKFGNAPIHEAVKLGKLDLIEFLVFKGAKVNIKGQFDYTPLHYAAEGEKLEIVKYLVSQGADVNDRDTYGNTPLHIAVKGGQLKIIQFLISNGANEKVRDNSGMTAQMLAHAIGQKNIEDFLLNFENNQEESSYTLKEKVVDKEKDEKTKPKTLPEVHLGNYYALVMGIDNYKFLPKLKTAINDARTVASVLKQNYGFEVELLIDAERSDLLLSLGKFRNTLSKQDNLLIYYAGHGWLDEAGDEGYWLPANAENDNTINWVSNSSITTTLKAMDAKHVLVIADSCYSGKLARGFHVVQRTLGYLSRLSGKRARCVISSGGLEPVIDSGGKGLHSVFASALVDALKENTDIMDGTQLFNRLRRPVMLNSDQTPEYSDIRKAGHDGGEFLFLRIK
jgi:ankyrin repeat protein